WSFRGGGTSEGAGAGAVPGLCGSWVTAQAPWPMDNLLRLVGNRAGFAVRRRTFAVGRRGLARRRRFRLSLRRRLGRGVGRRWLCLNRHRLIAPSLETRRKLSAVLVPPRLVEFEGFAEIVRRGRQIVFQVDAESWTLANECNCRFAHRPIGDQRGLRRHLPGLAGEGDKALGVVLVPGGLGDGPQVQVVVLAVPQNIHALPCA